MNQAAATRESVKDARFVRRTALRADEYRKNFRQVDADIIAAVTSREADAVTPLMSKVYLRLVNAPAQYREREGVLRFESEMRDGAQVSAWNALCETLGVASATARKALRWMHEQGVVGYFAGKNGVGIRVFLNRASSSIGTRAAGKKILEFTRTSPSEHRTSPDETAFSDSFAGLEVLETGRNPRAPENGAEPDAVVKNSLPETRPRLPEKCSSTRSVESGVAIDAGRPLATTVTETVRRLKTELESCVREVAARAATQSVSREMERTREWFETRALPKAVRVAQRETYDLMRRHGVAGGKGSAGPGVGRGTGVCVPAETRPLTFEELREAAEACVALLEAQGRPIEATLSTLSSEAGGWLLPEEVARVRELAMALASAVELSPPQTGTEDERVTGWRAEAE